MAPLLGLQDPSHEKFAETKENANAPFLRIPLELRLLIYEYATYEEKSIGLSQAAPRSNKFFCYSADGTYNTNKLKMVISHLVRVSRQIHIELEDNPVFYRVNKFQFQTPMELINFLVAITPERRAFLRHVVLCLDACGTTVFLPGLDAWPYSRGWDNKVMDHVAALLSRCKDLRRLGLQFSCGILWQQPNIDSVLHHLIPFIKSDDIGLTPWSSSCIEPSLALDGRTHIVDLIGARTEESSPANIPSMSQARIRSIDEAKTTLVSHRQRMKEQERNGNGFWDKYTDSQVNEAIAFSKVDFPGESRIQQDRFSSTSGTVSSRTRQKCKKELVDGNGVIQREKSKYTAEGTLASDRTKVHDIRWNGSAIEVDIQVYLERTENEQPERSWEPIEAVMTEANEYSILNYYAGLFIPRFSRIIPIFSRITAAERLQTIRALPTPKDVRASSPDLFVNLHSDISHAEKSKLKWRKIAWDRSQKMWQERVGQLEKEAEEEAMREKEKEKKEKQVQQQASKKRKTTTSRSSKRAKRS